ncbi:site-specific DNA-methyltransferase [Corallococcus sp. M34]|uniref:DNA-methyltransferase n=1 Tax=Citreicoccus inhibens TaxID=2849499 RepID=UPI001C240D77|nr:site-specific DNA-methyltransferase [Citreicoccus inhibens]MBU8900816.1 site-specific DNA-methyltransferase [Citreicoccus inhibens]
MTRSQEATLAHAEAPHPAALVPAAAPFYGTEHGAAYVADSRDVLRQLPDASINLVFTSPPYALHFKKEYGNVHKDEYVEWLLTFARDIFRVLKDDGSFVLNIGGSYNKGQPTRSTYHFKVLLALVEQVGFHLAQECFWYNPAKMPVPAEWVTVRRIRMKDAVEYVWWFSKSPWPKANNRNVLKPYSADMFRLNQRGVRATVRPSGHNIAASFDKVDAGGSIPANFFEEETPSDLIKAGNTAANDQYTKRCKEAGLKIHPARFPAVLPDFFIKLLTDEGDVVVDPFGGSNTTGRVAEGLGRRWLVMDEVREYLEASKFRFDTLLPASVTASLGRSPAPSRSTPRVAKPPKAGPTKRTASRSGKGAAR